MAWTEHVYEDASALAAALATALDEAIREALSERNRAHLALAGGRTPLPAYRMLAQRPLEWRHVQVLPNDERCVPHDHPASNIAELRNAFAPAEGVLLASLTTEDGDPAQSEVQSRRQLAFEPDPFDAIVLGMGMDAHTASLFPGAKQLAQALDPASVIDACRIDPDPLPPEAPFPRITLTLARLLRTRSMHLVLTGEGKHEVLRVAQSSQAESTDGRLRYPIAALLQAPDQIVHVHWSP